MKRSIIFVISVILMILMLASCGKKEVPEGLSEVDPSVDQSIADSLEDDTFEILTAEPNA